MADRSSKKRKLDDAQGGAAAATPGGTAPHHSYNQSGATFTPDANAAASEAASSARSSAAFSGAFSLTAASSSADASSSAYGRVGAAHHLAASVDPDKSVYAELASLRRENDRLAHHNGQLQRRISALAPRRKRLETMIHQIQNPNNKMQKRALARQVSIATGSALESQARQNAVGRKRNALADRIVEKCSGTASDKDFREIMQTPGFIREFLEMCKCAESIFGQEQRVLDLASPCYVLGDIHGNLDDLRFFSQKLWTLGMHLTGSSFLFMGDYVDRGMHGIEVVMYLLAYKIKVPHKVFLLRGNHETRAVNGWIDWYKQRCFLYQCRALFRQFGDLVWESVNRVFDTLPFAATVDRSIFCVHGGIPPKELHLPGRDRIEQMQRIPCPVQIPFPSEHLSGAIDSEDEAGGEDEDEEGDTGAAGSSSASSSAVVMSSNAATSAAPQEIRLAPVAEVEEQNTAADSLVAAAASQQLPPSSLPVTQPDDGSQESVDIDEDDELGSEPSDYAELRDSGEESGGGNVRAREHSWASQATQANSTQGDDEDEDEGEGTEDERAAQAEMRKYYQRLAFNTIWADPADISQEMEMARESGSAFGAQSGGVPGSGGAPPEKKHQRGFTKGHRGEDSVVYGWNAIEDFLKETGCQLIMRAHEATAGGVKICKHAKVITVFSTSKDHGVGRGKASCACVLVDRESISVINRSPLYDETYVDPGIL